MKHPGITETYLRSENGSLLTDRLSGGQLLLLMLPGGGSALKLEGTTLALHDGRAPIILDRAARSAIRDELEASSVHPVRKRSLKAMIERALQLTHQHATQEER